MKTQFIDKLVSQPWSIERKRGRALLSSLVQKIRSDRPAEDNRGRPLPKLSIVGDVAFIPVVGSLLMGLPDYVKEWGLALTDVNDIEQELAQALNDPRVAFVVMDWDSPGGWSVAGNKLFDLVESFAQKKPIFSWCADGAEMCSAAYDGAAPSRMILAGRYALNIGCIGSYYVVLDDSEYWKELGIEWKVFRSGTLKGIGIDAVSDEQADYLQAMTDRFGEKFRSNVSRFRLSLPRTEMEGQYYCGEEAAQRFFVDGNASDLTAALAKFRGLL